MTPIDWFTRLFSDEAQHQMAFMPFIRAPEGESAIVLSGLEISVQISGLLAEITQTMRFTNPNPRTLEGNLTLPMPPGAVVCGYGLDVEGVLVEGVVVPKEEARRILEAEVRKGVDPGLIEQTQGNQYQTRIYPIPGNGHRTVQVTTVSALTTSGNAAACAIPLAYAQDVASVRLRVEVIQSPVAPKISGGLGNLSLNLWQERWVAEATLGAGRPCQDVLIELPDLPDTITVVEQTPAGEHFFCLSTTLPAPTAAAWKPARLAVAWDASGSAQDTDTERALLRELLVAWRGVVVELVVFRDQPEPTVVFETQEDGGAALLAALRAAICDGGTRLSALDLSSAPGDAEAWLVFSDGLSNLGPALPKVGTTPVFTITGASHADAALCRHLAQCSGGATINLNQTTSDDARALILAGPTTPQLTAWTGGELPVVYRQGGRLVVMGPLAETGVELSVAGCGSFTVGRDGASHSRLVARAWAGTKAQAAALVDGKTAPSVLALARRYGLVTPGTSLLVLESLEQHLEHDIEPPASRTTLRTQWHARRAKKETARSQKQQAHLNALVVKWSERIEWWKTTFSPSKVKPSVLRAPEVSRGDDTNETTFMSAPPPMASMSVPSPPHRTMRRSRPASPRSQGAAPPAKKAPARSAAATVSIQPWDPKTPYLQAMDAAADRYAAYLQQRPAHASSPSFFLDCGDNLLRNNQTALGLRVLSNLMELGLDDVGLMRMYAWRLQQAGALDQSIEVLEAVAAKRDDEPQSHRDLALALGQRFDEHGSAADLSRSVELLYSVVLRQWSRFPEIEIIALMELNRMLYRADLADITVQTTIDERLIHTLDLDLRISLSWDADLTDVDLHVHEPAGDHICYRNQKSPAGGLVSRDFTQGYGPEEYIIRRAPAGSYRINAHYYGSHQQTLTGPCTVIATVYTNYSRPNEQRQMLTLRLEKPGENVTVGSIAVAPSTTEEPAQEPTSPAKTLPDWWAVFASLRVGMTLNEIVTVCGQPATVGGSDQIQVLYRPADGVEIEIIMGPLLLSVHQNLQGARFKIL